MTRTPARSIRSATTVLLGVIAAAGLTTRDAHAQATGRDSDPHVVLSLRRAGVALGAALAVNLFAAHLWFEVHADEDAPPPPPPPFPPAPPCCYAPPPPPVVMFAPAPPSPTSNPLQLGLAVSGLVQSSGSSPGQSPIAGVAAALQVRTSAHSIFGLEVQSLTSDRTTTHSRRDELAGLMAGRLFPWDAPLAPYIELAGGLGRASIDTEALEVNVSQLIGRAGIGVELRLGPHLVLDGQLAQVHRFDLDHQSRDLAASDPAFVGEHERLTELRCGLGYRF